MTTTQSSASLSTMDWIEDGYGENKSDEIIQDPNSDAVYAKACLQQNASCDDLSLFSTIRDLFFSPFIDGYCKGYAPFSMAGDYYPPNCPSNGCCIGDFGEMREDTDVNGRSRGQQEHHEHFQRVASTSRRPKLRPLAVAVGYDTMKDAEGRQVFITPSSSMRRPMNSPYYQVSSTKSHENRSHASY